MAIKRNVGLKNKQYLHRNEFTFFFAIKICVFKFSRPVQENSGGVLTVKLDYVLKGALVDIIPVLIMKNIIDTASY
jgi:hypothetical protein